MPFDQEAFRREARAAFAAQYRQIREEVFAEAEAAEPLATLVNSERREKIAALALAGATEGERAAARAALLRIDAEHATAVERLSRDAQDEADFEDAAAFGEA